MKQYLSVYCLFLMLFFTSCVETVLVGSTATGVIVAQEKSVSNTTNDIVIESKIITEFIKKGLKNPLNKVNVTVDEQRVLLTGIVDDVNLAKKASEICWKVEGVKEVIDEIQLVDNKSAFGSFGGYFRDSAITAQIASKMLFNKKIKSINFDVITVNKVVYIIGIAQNTAEIKLIDDIASKTNGVERVISHIILASDKRRN